MSTTLSALANDLKLTTLHSLYGTDKFSPHSYGKFYDSVFPYFKCKNHINLLEIGFRHGASLVLWANYFQNGSIYGLDNLSDKALQSTTFNFPTSFPSNVYFSICDAYHDPLPINFPTRYDIIIDDGPHFLWSQKVAISRYSSLLTKEGILIIEDILIGGLAILPLLLSVPLGYIPKFYDYRLGSKLLDDCIVTIKRAPNRHLEFIHKLSFLALGLLYILPEGIIRLLLSLKTRLKLL